MALEVQIKKKFPGFSLDVEFKTGEGIFGVLGESGCGKSLTLKCIAGIETPEEGRIVLNGRVLFDSSQGINLPARERNVGYLFQEYALFPHMTVEENIAIGEGTLRKYGKKRGKKERKRMIESYIDRFFLHGLEKKYPSELSGGQKQRVAFARMMATEPEIILLDEPFSAIDSYLKWQIEQQLVDWLDLARVTTLLVSHNRDEIYRLCDQMGIIYRGKMEVCGNKKEIFHDPVTVSAAILTGCKNIAEIKWLSEKEDDWGYAEIPKWGLRLPKPETLDEMQKKADQKINYVGIRAHDMSVCLEEEESGKWKEDGESLKVPAVVERKIEAPFAYIYVVRPTEPGAESMRVEISKEEGSILELGQKVHLRLLWGKILWLCG